MRQATVTEAVSTAAIEIGIAIKPVASAFASRDQDVIQMVALLNEVADEVLVSEPYKSTLSDGMWIADGDTGELKDRPTKDGDRILFDRRMAISGLKWRFLKAKGLEFAEVQRDFTTRMNVLACEANGKVIDIYADEGVVI